MSGKAHQGDKELLATNSATRGRTFCTFQHSQHLSQPHKTQKNHLGNPQKNEKKDNLLFQATKERGGGIIWGEKKNSNKPSNIRWPMYEIISLQEKTKAERTKSTL